jgi:hypothetical protein
MLALQGNESDGKHPLRAAVVRASPTTVGTVRGGASATGGRNRERGFDKLGRNARTFEGA